MRGVSIATENVLKELSNTEIVSDYTLIGGTALSLSLGHRLSEDIDLCTWDKATKMQDTETIYQSLDGLRAKGHVTILLDSDLQKDFLMDNVKVTFFYDPTGYPIIEKHKQKYNKLSIASVPAIAGMKACVTLNRAKFRDYYDLFSIAYGGHCSLAEILSEANEYKPHYNTRMILQNIQSLADSKEEDLDLLKPIYDIKTKEIEYFFRQLLVLHSRIDKIHIKDIVKVNTIEENKKYHDTQIPIEFTKSGLS
jgi:Nucleotidyl transferase AbiEii toxin, Type IV TA system